MRAAAIGIWGGVSGLGIAVGPLIGGAVVEGMNWHSIFWLNVPISVICMALIWYTIDESYGRPQPLDFLGLILAGMGLFGLRHRAWKRCRMDKRRGLDRSYRGRCSYSNLHLVGITRRRASASAAPLQEP